MSSTAAGAIVAIVLVFGLLTAYRQIHHAMRHESTRDRLIREAHQRATAAHEIDELELAYSLPALDPAWDAGRERLWDAVRDQQNQTKGDQL